MTVAKALSSPHQLSSLRKTDEESLVNSMCVLLTGLAKSINVGKNLDTLQTYETATLLIEKFWYLRLEECMYVFKQAKLGKYGQLFDRLDITIISGWLDTYDRTERLAEVEQQRRQQMKAEINEPLPMEEVQRCYRKLAAGEKLDNHTGEKRSVHQAAEMASKEAEFFKFQMSYFRNRQLETEKGAVQVGEPANEVPTKDEGEWRDHERSA